MEETQRILHRHRNCRQTSCGLVQSLSCRFNLRLKCSYQCSTYAWDTDGHNAFLCCYVSYLSFFFLLSKPPSFSLCFIQNKLETWKASLPVDVLFLLVNIKQLWLLSSTRSHVVLKAAKQTLLRLNVMNQWFKLTDLHSFKKRPPDKPRQWIFLQGLFINNASRPTEMSLGDIINLHSIVWPCSSATGRKVHYTFSCGKMKDERSNQNLF